MSGSPSCLTEPTPLLLTAESPLQDPPPVPDAGPPLAEVREPRVWRLALRAPILLLVALVGVPVLLLALLPGVRDLPVAGQPLSLRVQRRYARILLRALGYRLRIHGAMPEGACLVVANHISGFDIPVLHAVAPLWLVAKQDIRDWPLVGALARAVGTIFIQRGSENSRRRAARRMTALMQRGRIVGVFPEGGIHTGRGVKRFHPRLFGPAIRAGAPVVPMAIRYWRDGDLHDEQVFGPGLGFVDLVIAALGRPAADIQVRIGTPIPAVEGSAERTRNEVAREAQARVTEMYCHVDD